MAQAPQKKVSEMTREEYAASKDKFIKTDGTKWDLVVTAIRTMTKAELTVFEAQYGITIVLNPNSTPYSRMTEGEKAAFCRIHGMDPAEMQS